VFTVRAASSCGGFHDEHSARAQVQQAQAHQGAHGGRGAELGGACGAPQPDLPNSALFMLDLDLAAFHAQTADLDLLHRV
jgi:hypothetical protein